MRIGLDVRKLTHLNTGIGSYIFNFVQTLTTVETPHQFFLFVNSPDDSAALKFPPNFQVVVVPSYRWDKLQDQLGLLKATFNFNLDIFHTTHHDVTPLLMTCPLVATVHDLAPMDFPNPSWPHRFYYRWFSWLALRRARHLVCVSHSTGQRLEHHFPFCRGKWSTVYEGRDPFFQVLAEPELFGQLSQQFNIKTPFLLYVGSFARRKNLPAMIEAFSIIKKTKPDMQFVIVGKPSGRDDVLPTQLPDDMIIINQLNKRDLRALYNQAKALLFNTLYEGFGIPILEAMACGCPVVTSPTTSLPELGGEAVLYAPPHCPAEIAKQVLHILNEETMWQMMRDKGLKQVLQFDWLNTVSHTLKIYQDIKSNEHRP